MNILLIVSSYYPSDGVGALRWRRFVKYLTKWHKFTIIVRDSNNCKGVSVRKKQYSDQEEVYECVFEPNWFEKIADRIANFKYIEQRLRLKISELFHFPHESYSWGREVMTFVDEYFKKGDFDIVISSHPSIGCHRAAAEVSKHHGIPWVADFRDPFAQYQHLVSFYQRSFKPLLQLCEKNLLVTASCIVCTNKEMGKIVFPSFKGDKFFVSNCYDKTEFKQLPLNDVITITYTGSVGGCVELNTFLEGLVELRNSRKNLNELIQVHYYGNSFKDIKSHKLYPLVDSVIYDKGLVLREKLLPIISSSDLLLSFAWNGPNPEIADSGKTYDYLGSGRPILVTALNLKSKMASIINEVGGGLVALSPQEVRNFIDELIEDRHAFSDRLRKLRISKDKGVYELTHKGSQYKNILREVSSC